MAAPLSWPRKTRELRNHHLDSSIWNHFRYRPGDVIVASYPKSGTTWTQQIVGQLLTGGVEFPINQVSPWMDSRLNPRRRLAAVAAQKHRRVLKSHLPLDALVYSPQARYLYVARDGRDVVWSLHHNHVNATEAYFRLLNEPPGLVGPPLGAADPDIRQYFRRWLDEDGYPFWSYWDHIRSWWAARELPNIHLVHFNDLKQDIEGEMRRIAEFLGREIEPDKWPMIVEHCSFEYMKQHSTQVAPPGAVMMKGGARAFINKGENGRWRDVLDADDLSDYERIARQQLGEECSDWLAHGSSGRSTG